MLIEEEDELCRETIVRLKENTFAMQGKKLIEVFNWKFLWQ